MPKQRVTPRPAASARSVDRWQKELRLIIRALWRRHPLLRMRTIRRLEGLLASMDRAERR